MSSWILRTLLSYGKDALTEVPTIHGIQQALVDMNDKPAEFINSTEWIGALEVCDKCSNHKQQNELPKLF